MSRTRKAVYAALVTLTTPQLANRDEAVKLCQEALDKGDFIRVEDALPPDCEACLVVVRSPRHVTQAFHNKGDFYVGSICVDATHWQPMPAPPKENP